jgi:hypothetical protein
MRGLVFHTELGIRHDIVGAPRRATKNMPSTRECLGKHHPEYHSQRSAHGAPLHVMIRSVKVCTLLRRSRRFAAPAQLGHCRTLHPPDRAQPKERSVRRIGWRRRTLGHNRLTDRDL